MLSTVLKVAMVAYVCLLLCWFAVCFAVHVLPQAGMSIIPRNPSSYWVPYWPLMLPLI